MAKPFRLALGSLLVQNKLGCSDRELVEQLTENPYLQYFMGMLGCKVKPPINASTLVLFRKKITMEILQEVNERMLEEKAAKTDDDKKDPPKGNGSREKLEGLIKKICEENTQK